MRQEKQMYEDHIRALARDELLRTTLVPASDVVTALGNRELDPEVKAALIKQLDAWLDLAKFAKRLSIGLAIGSGLLGAYLISLMTWDDLFAGSGLWEFSLLLFALAVFVASPLAIFVLGRPLKGVDEWSPALTRPGS
jgi:hypothetical protein